MTANSLGARLEQPVEFDFISLRTERWQALLECLRLNEPAANALNEVMTLERFWAFPGIDVLHKIQDHLQQGRKHMASQLANNCMQVLNQPRQKAFEPFVTHLDKLDKPKFESGQSTQQKPCFELLILHPNPLLYRRIYLSALSALQTERDEFYYELIFVQNLADAITALWANPTIQACLAVSGASYQSEFVLSNQTLAQAFSTLELGHAEIEDAALLLQRLARQIRPELELYYLSEQAFALLPTVYFERFHRVFYHEYPFKDLHYHMMNGVRERYNTPFYSALQAYSKKPKAVFHALPISRAHSIKDSIWLKDFYQFYGDNLFLSETSATQGGMDSLLNPKGAIKNAQAKAAACFGAQKTFFVTNGTSTSNKIVMQANLQPGDIVFVSSDCHKSVPYGVMLSGARAVFLQTNAVIEYDLYGAVSLTEIQQRLLALKAVGELDKVKQIILTNSTFDGLLYDVEHYMMAILAIKPDMIFHWDEAWFAHAHFNCLYQRRHAMAVAKRLRQRFNSETYRTFYVELSDEEKLHWPDPARVVLRVYATQSTHKTLSCFRQGSMIHVHDEQFNQPQFLEAFYTHTSTSPNYQILASLDMARRQMNLEGFALTQTCLRLAEQIRHTIACDPTLKQIFKVLEAHDMYPAQATQHSVSEPTRYLDLMARFLRPGFVVDPTRITLDIHKTGMSGDSFRKLLIDKYDIQVNKTSQHTVLFIVNIGIHPQTSEYLIEVLREVAERLLHAPAKQVIEPQTNAIAMPQMRRYHPAFSAQSSVDFLVDVRQAYYAANQSEQTDYLSLDSNIMLQAQQGQTWVSAAFVTPYPPGFPMLVPGQIIDYDFLLYFSGLTIKEIHGYQAESGLKIFQASYLDRISPQGV